jgi:hypothetical protein
MPEGMRIEGTPEQIAAAKKAGIQDVIVDLPSTGTGWREALVALEASGMRYIISVNGLMPAAKGIAVEPEAYRVSGITTDQHVEFAMPGATSAMVLLVTERDATLQSSQRVPIVNGKFIFDVKAPNSLEQVLLVYPEQSEATHPDYWDGFDNQRDTLLTALQRDKPGKGLRGILNPLGQMFGATNHVGRFVPESTYFRMEFRAYVESKYRNMQTAMRSWAMGTNDIESFDGLARLVPMWSGTRGIGELWDPTNDRMYTCDQQKSLIWNDIDAVVQMAAAKRFERLVPAVQHVVDVPVIQEWSGWSAPFEATTPELSGLAFRGAGNTSEDVLNAGARATSSVARWKGAGWLICSDVEHATSGVTSVFDDYSAMGVRGWFVSSDKPEVQTAVAVDASRREADLTLSSFSPVPLYFPENAFNPAGPRTLAGNKYWLPSPADGNRIDYGAGFEGYRYFDGTSYSTVLWTNGSPGRVRLRLMSPKTAVFATCDGSDPKIKLLKTGVELTLDNNPLTISGTEQLPVPEPSFVETTVHFDQLLRYGDATHHDIAQSAYRYKDAMTSFERDPGTSFLLMRAQLGNLNRQLGKFVWVEAEATRDTNFSEIAPVSGCSNGAVLAMHTPVTTDQRGYFANYVLPVRTDGNVDVWIAGRIPEGMRKFVTVVVAGQRFDIKSPPVSSYAAGYEWYNLGTTKLNGHEAKVSVEVNAPDGAELMLDTVLLYPGGTFQPDGIHIPDAMVFATPQEVMKKGRKKGG